MQFSYLLLYATILFASQCVCSVNNESGDKGKKRPIPSQITVTSWNDLPYSAIEKRNGKWVGKGYAFDIFHFICYKLNISYTIIPPNEHILGDEKNGVLGVLYQKKADIAVAFLPVLLDMRKYCEFSTALDETRITAIMKRPQISATGSGLLAPFEGTVWLLVLASLLCIGPTIYIFSKISSKLWNDTTSHHFTLSSCFWFAYSSFLKQGSSIVATTNSIRILFATWWIFILILTSFYTANLTAFLTKPQFTLSISSLHDIVYMGYNWVTFKGKAIEFLLSQDHENDLSLLNVSRHRRRGIFKQYDPSENILNHVGPRRLFLAEAHYLQTVLFQNYMNDTRNHLDHNFRCGYVIMPEAILITNRAFAFPHGSRLIKDINAILLRFVQTGIIQQRKEKHLPLAEICPVDLRSSERQLQNNDLILTYKVVIAGYIIAAIVFLFEIIYAFILHRVKNSKVKHNSRVRREKSNQIQKSMNDISMLKKPPVMYPATENLMLQPKQQFINGRHYYVITDKDGDRRLIPMRTPSAFLFQSIA